MLASYTLAQTQTRYSYALLVGATTTPSLLSISFPYSTPFSLTIHYTSHFLTLTVLTLTVRYRIR